MSKIGFHVSSGNRRGFGEALQQCAQAGHPIAVVFSLDQDLWPDIADKSPLTYYVFRTQKNAAGEPIGDGPGSMYAGNPEQSARDWMAGILPVWAENKAHAYAPLNEQDPPDLPGFAWLNRFLLECLFIAEANGYVLAIGAFSAGNPKDVPDPAIGAPFTAEDAWRELVPVLQRAKQQQHVLLLHEYGFDVPATPEAPATTLRASAPHLALRYRRAYRFLHSFNATPDLVISEASAGVGYKPALGSITKQQWLDDATWYNAEVSRDAAVIGFCLYQAGGAEDLSEMFPQIANVAATTPTPAPEGDPVVGLEEPPQPPGECRGAPRMQYKRVVNVVTAQADAQTVLDLTWPQTVTNSYDDAGIGDLDARTAVLWNLPTSEQQSYRDWYAQYYPGVAVEFKSTQPPPPNPGESFWVQWPVKAEGGEIPHLTSRFNAPRPEYSSGTNRLHEGVDSDAYINSLSKNATILAAQDGVVEYVNNRTDVPSYGRHIVIRHPWGNEPSRYRTLYAHLSSTSVQVGQTVSRGQPIGSAGGTGVEGGVVHLHFNVHDAVEGLHGYVRCTDCSGKWPDGVIDPASIMRYPETPPTGTIGLVTVRSVHGRADGGDLRSIDVQGAKTSPLVNGYKVFKSPPNTYASLVQNGISAANIITRLDHVRDRRVTAAQYINGSTGFYDLPIKEALAGGVTWLEIFNEPNLGVEGFGVAWISINDFCDLCLGVINLIKAHYPTVKIISPALSQNPAEWWTAFQQRGIFAACAGLGEHCYWDCLSGHAFPMDSEAGGRRYRKLFQYLMGAQKIYITEASNNATFDSDLDKGAQYAQYCRTMEMAKVARVDFFCISSSDVGDGALFNQRRETWVRGNMISDIPKAMV